MEREVHRSGLFRRRRGPPLLMATVALAATLFALTATHTATAGPTSTQLEAATLNLSDLPAGWRGSSGFILDWTYRTVPFGNYFTAYLRGVPSSSKVETLVISLADADAGPVAAKWVEDDIAIVWEALSGRGATWPQPAPALGAETKRYRLSSGGGATAIAGDAIFWRHNNVYALVMVVTDGVEQTDGLMYANMQQAKLVTAFGPAATATATATASPTATATVPSAATEQVPLFAGCNNVTLTWPNGTAMSTISAAIQPAEAVIAIWRFDSAQQRFVGFSAQFPAASDLTAANRGDAVFICMRGPATLTRPAI